MTIERLMRINSVAPIVLSKYVVRKMMADGGGAIVTQLLHLPAFPP